MVFIFGIGIGVGLALAFLTDEDEFLELCQKQGRLIDDLRAQNK
jgi:hypothetical protein